MASTSRSPWPSSQNASRDQMSVAGAPSATIPAMTVRTPSLRCTWLIALAPVPQHGDRVAAAHHHVPGLQAQPDVGPVEDLLDLPRGLHVGPGLRVEGGLVAAVAAAAHHPGQALGEPAPRRRRRGRARAAQRTGRAGRAAARLPASARVGRGGGPGRYGRTASNVSSSASRSRALPPARHGRRRAAPGSRRPGPGPARPAARPAVAAAQVRRPARGRCPRNRPRPPGRARLIPSGTFGSWPTVISNAP